MISEIGALCDWRKWHSKGGERLPRAEDFDTIVGICSAVTDIPAAAFAAEMITAYLDAKTILNTRCSLDAWFASNLSNFGVIRGPCLVWLRSWFHTDLYWLSRTYNEVFYQHYYGNFGGTGK